MVDDRVSGARRTLPAGAVREVADSAPIYHYTDPAGLLGILRSHELWATEASGMNDLAEVHQGWDFIKSWLERQDPTDSAVKDMLSVARAAAHGPDAHVLRSTNGIYICSATFLDNDASQWRLYAAGGRGYALELDPLQRLSAVLHDPRPRPEDEPYAFYPTDLFERVSVTPWYHVYYTDEDKEMALEALLENARAQRAEVVADALSEDEFDEQMQIFEADTLGQLAQLAQLMKSRGFSGENEVRTIVTDWWSRLRNFRATRHGIVRYAGLTQQLPDAADNQVLYDDEIQATKTLPIKSIRLGPLIHALNNRDTIRALADLHGFTDCRIDNPGGIALAG